MIATLIAMWGLAGATAFMAWRRPGRFAVGLGYAKEQLLIILPRLPISFFAAGFIAGEGRGFDVPLLAAGAAVALGAALLLLGALKQGQTPIDTAEPC